MEKPTHDQIKELLQQVILPFYEVERDMLVPTRPKGERRSENDAEHSWSVSVLACSLAPHIDPSLDVGLVSQFAIVHDLVEVYADDTSVWAEEGALASKAAKEVAALTRFKQKFSHFPWLVGTLEAYERQDTNEARYVRAIDKYIALCIRFMDGGEFYHRKGITKRQFEASLITHREKAHGHKAVAEYYELIRSEYDQHPEYFASQ